jgi:diguanylate cyclase (GGDEF)-like protein/PAS domain S-box-containing protein
VTSSRRRRPGHPWAALKGEDPALHGLAHYLRAVIDNADVTMKQLASELGCSTASISKKLNGSTLPEESFVLGVVRVCTKDIRIVNKRLGDAKARWARASSDQGVRIRRPDARLDDPRALIITAQERVIQVHEQLHEANLQLRASERAEQRTTKMVWTLTWALGQIVQKVRDLTAERDAALAQAATSAVELDATQQTLADATGIHERTQSQLGRAKAEHHRAQQLVRTVEDKIERLRAKVRALTMPSQEPSNPGTSENQPEPELDDLKAGLERMHRLLDEQEEELQELSEQIGPAADLGQPWPGSVPVQVGEATFEDVADSSFDGIVITDLDGAFISINDAFSDTVGYSAADLAHMSFFELVHPEEVPFVRAVYEELLNGYQLRIRQQRRLVHENGSTIRVTLAAKLLRRNGDEPSRVMTVIEDSTEMSLLQGQLSFQSLHDSLTGLPNRQYFTTYLEGALRRADPVTGVTVYHLDLDGFSVITGGLGRLGADRLLMSVASRLKAMFAGEKAMVARFDGEEFAVLVENTSNTPQVSTMVAMVNEELEQPIYFDGRGVAAMASIGVVHRPSSSVDPAELLRTSAMTLARAKTTGRRQWALFAPELHAKDLETFTLAAEMPGAFEMGDIDVSYKPIVRFSDGKVFATEAVVYWNHATLGVISGDRCLGLAEATGFAWTLASLLLDAAFAQLQTTSETHFSVNLTAQQASDPDLAPMVNRLLTETRVAPDRLWLGLPLDALSAAKGNAVDNLTLLAEKGIYTVASNFKAAVSDLVCLTDLPLRAVRVARGLVEREPIPGASITNAILNLPDLVHQSGADVIVDGICTEEQARWWDRAGADFAQGPLWQALA